jgi:hypothetical protein
VNALKAIEGYQISMLAYSIERLKADPRSTQCRRLAFLIKNGAALWLRDGDRTTHHRKNLPLLFGAEVTALSWAKHRRASRRGRVERIPAANLLLSILPETWD